MTFPEAVRLGAMLGPQVFGLYARGAATCAMGAALLANGQMDPAWSVCRMAPATCPVCGLVVPVHDCMYPGAALVVHLNDVHTWSRERIADWVELQEVAEVPAAVEAV